MGHTEFPSLPIVDLGAFERVDDAAGDYDLDGIANCEDNCPTLGNPDQKDCNDDGEGDACQLAYCVGDRACDDCNGNGLPDSCDLASGQAVDLEDNGRPDTCETAIFVDDDAPPGGDGSSWATAYAFLQDALANATPEDVVRVAVGTYRPDRDEAGRVVNGARTSTFQLVNGVGIHGGFAGLAMPAAPDDRDSDLYETILTGDLNADDGPEFANTNDNSYHVVTGTGTRRNTIIDGFTITGGHASGFSPQWSGGGMHNGPGSWPTVRRCTFYRNWAEYGAGLYNDRAKSSIEQCKFIENSVEDDGGAIYNDFRSPSTISQTLFRGNRADHAGGAVYNELSDARLTDCQFSENSSSLYGGAMYNDGGQPRLFRCDFESNDSTWGGAIHETGGSAARIIQCVFRANSARNGGAIDCNQARPDIAGSWFVDNVAQSGGAIEVINRGRANVFNSVLSGNKAKVRGGAIYNAGTGYLVVTNSTLTANYAWLDSGGLFNAGTAKVNNSILWGNTTQGPVNEEAQMMTSGPIDLRASCIQGLHTWTGDGNIGSNPLFANARGADGTAGTLDDDLRLRPGSPCVDAGDTCAGPLDATDLDDDGNVVEFTPHDAGGNPRLIDDPGVVDAFGEGECGGLPGIDMGAYERPDDSGDDPDSDGRSNCTDNCPWEVNTDQADCDNDGTGDVCTIRDCESDLSCRDCDGNGVPDGCDLAAGALADLDGNERPDECQTVYYVDDDAPPGGDGASWQTAFAYLQDALIVALAGDEVRVAGGVYVPDQDEGGRHVPGDQSATFRPPGGVTVRGGFAGLESPHDPDARLLATYETVLSGDLLGDDALDPGNVVENSEHVTTVSWTPLAPVLDGITITGGRAVVSYQTAGGGGMYLYRSSLRMEHCVVRGNRGGQAGAGIYSGNATSVILDTRFEDNIVGNVGGGMYVYEGRTTISDCAFVRNEGYRGGGVYLASDRSLITESTFLANTATIAGGALVIADDSEATIARCVLAGNRSGDRGGAAVIGGAAPALRNPTFVANVGRRGGAIYLAAANPTVSGCTFAANAAVGGGTALAADMQFESPSSVATVVNSILWNDGTEIIKRTNSTVSVSYSIVRGGWPGDGNVDLDPLFLQVPEDGGDGWGDDPDTTETDEGANDDYGDLHLAPDSPARDAGDPTFLPAAGETDLDGHPRLFCGRVDMGALESGAGDFDCDGSIGLRDVAAFQRCFGGSPNAPYDASCVALDFNDDGGIDLDDYAQLALRLAK